MARVSALRRPGRLIRMVPICPETFTSMAALVMIITVALQPILCRPAIHHDVHHFSGHCGAPVGQSRPHAAGHTGERLELAAGTEHAATVGPDGVTCREFHAS